MRKHRVTRALDKKTGQPGYRCSCGPKVYFTEHELTKHLQRVEANMNARNLT